jgi:hypothetical protein
MQKYNIRTSDVVYRQSVSQSKMGAQTMNICRSVCRRVNTSLNVKRSIPSEYLADVGIPLDCQTNSF